MSSINFPDDNDDPQSPFLEVSSGEDIDFESSQEDAVIEFAAFNHEGKYTPMCPYGYSLNLEEAKVLRDFLNHVIAEAERG